MMKNYRLFCLLAFAFSLMSCSDFLDKDIQGNATDDTYYDTRYKM